MKRFLCDQMSSDLGHWLRIAGYDTEIVTVSMQDEKVFEKAVNEKRLLLTRDKYFKKLDPDGKSIVYLKSDSIDDCAQQLKKEAGVDWLFCPFSRCLKCNSLLKITTPSRENKEIPAGITDFWICPTCNHLFWLGSHTQRMKSRLIDWQTKGKNKTNDTVVEG